MDYFTFVSMTYNHEAYIKEHLDSIRNIILKYGDDIEVDLIIADDCSTDQTVPYVKSWIIQNGHLFHKTTILERCKNIGVVRNVVEAFDMVQTDMFKCLAGDDIYLNNNIFQLVRDNPNEITITKCRLIGEGVTPERNTKYQNGFEFLKYLYVKNRVATIQGITHLFYTPGVFFQKSLWDDEIRNFMKQYKWIEDIPMWWYMICKKKHRVTVIDREYVAYRVSSGISTNKAHEKRISFETERDIIRKRFLKKYKYPKYINPYRYWLKWQKLLFAIHQNKSMQCEDKIEEQRPIAH